MKASTILQANFYFVEFDNWYFIYNLVPHMVIFLLSTNKRNNLQWYRILCLERSQGKINLTSTSPVLNTNWTIDGLLQSLSHNVTLTLWESKKHSVSHTFTLKKRDGKSIPLIKSYYSFFNHFHELEYVPTGLKMIL